jgi:hypothetical protein
LVENKEKGVDEKIDYLNQIFIDLINDATDLSEDLINGIRLNFVLGVISIVFAVQSLWYNRGYISEGDWVPIILASIMIISGLIIIYRGFILQNKYSRVFRARRELKQI